MLNRRASARSEFRVIVPHRAACRVREYLTLSRSRRRALRSWIEPDSFSGFAIWLMLTRQTRPIRLRPGQTNLHVFENTKNKGSEMGPVSLASQPFPRDEWSCQKENHDRLFLPPFQSIARATAADWRARRQSSGPQPAGAPAASQTRP